MHHTNNVVIMQTEQLGRIEALEEELHSSRVQMVEMEQKMTELLNGGLALCLYICQPDTAY